jgi:HTH-type transcriptional regulator/antitoxin HigA
VPLDNPKLFDDSPIQPGEILRAMIKDRGWSQDEFALIVGRSRQAINEIIAGKVGVTPEMAVTLSAAFGNPASEWMRWDAAYRLSLIKDESEMVKSALRLYEVAPVREMQKRGWIKETKDPAELEQELKNFFGVDTLDSSPLFPVAMRKASSLSNFSSPERAWLFRARRLAQALVIVPRFIPQSLPNAQARLRELAAYPSEACHVPKVLLEHGIRFVVVEPIAGAKLDGAAFWLDDASPVIAVSGRFDRIDAFWFTVMHEFMHIKNHDALSVDSDMFGEDRTLALVEEEIESRANQQAADALIGADEMDSFIRRVSPLYSKERIIKFAHRIKIHPGIIVGQLQHRREIGWGASREMLVKVRQVVTETALTDGWGKIITENAV